MALQATDVATYSLSDAAGDLTNGARLGAGGGGTRAAHTAGR
jgi:hypothetical protein